jgi:hypothetical protein
VKVIPQVVAYASKGGWSIALAQFDFGQLPCPPLEPDELDVLAPGIRGFETTDQVVRFSSNRRLSTDERASFHLNRCPHRLCYSLVVRGQY